MTEKERCVSTKELAVLNQHEAFRRSRLASQHQTHLNKESEELLDETSQTISEVHSPETVSKEQLQPEHGWSKLLS